MSGASTYNLSSVYRALGVRDPRAIPNIAGAALVPVVVMGSFEAFAPEVVEARGFINSQLANILAGQWVGLFQQSTAPGGTIIEHVLVADGSILNLAPTKPFTAANVTPMTLGGQPLSSLFEQTGIQVGPFPLGGALGGSNSPQPVYNSPILGQIWVPPGWFFWSIMIGANPTAYSSWRFREIPEAQGPA